MHSAAAIIDALNARPTAEGRLRAAARESWAGWLDRLAQRPGRVTGAPAQSLVDQLAARPLSTPPPRALPLSRWQAFATLWRQDWHAASRDERRWRWTAGGVSLGWHLLLVPLFLWVAIVQFLGVPPRQDESALTVEYVGVGAREEGGGTPSSQPGRVDAAAAGAPTQSSPAPALPSPEVPQPALPVPDIVAPVPDVATRDVPEPAPAQQRVAVSEAVSPEPPVFELPPTTPPTPELAAPRAAEVPPVRVVEIPEPVRAPESRAPAPRLEPRAIDVPPQAVAQRDVPEPVRLPERTLPTPTVQAPAISARTPDIARRDVPAPAAARPAAAPPATGTTPTPAAAPTGSASAATARVPQGAPGASATQRPAPVAGTGVGTGPRAAPAPGSWATPRAADDWGESTRNRPGRGDGVFDGDGRPRIAAAPGSASPGRPPGTVTQEIGDLDRAGTWLRRKPHAYEPTRFDRFWRPNETLLQEWVRKGFRQVAIPIPGSNKRIVCGISILQLGGGCWPEDPDLNDQPATARPPPDVPFKPHLQEGAGVTVPPAPATGSPPGG